MPDSACETIHIGGKVFRLIISPDVIQNRTNEIVAQLSEQYRDTNPILVCVLNGAALFHADVVRAMDIPLQIDYVRVASYHGATETTGNVVFTAEVSADVAGRHVVIVEDILDTGTTVERLRRYFSDKGAASMEVVALLYKKSADRFGIPPEHYGFEIADQFVIGCGLDYMQQGRNLPGVYALDEPVNTV